MFADYPFQRFIKVIKGIAINLQRQNYWYILVPTIFLSVLSIYLNKGLPILKDELALFSFYIENQKYFFLDSLAGALCFLMVIPTMYSWWKLQQEFYFEKHLPVLVFAISLLILGFCLSIALMFVLIIAGFIFLFFYLYSLIRR